MATLTQISTYTVPSPDIYGTAVTTGEISAFAGPELLYGSGTDIDTTPVFGRLTAKKTDGSTLFTYTSTTTDYIMSVEVGDVDGDGVNEIAVGLRDKDKKGVLLKNDGTFLWEYSVATGGIDYLRVARIGKLTANAGNQVFFAGALGRYVLLDKNGTAIWDLTISGQIGNPSIQGGVIADADGDGKNEIYIANNAFIRKINPADGSIIWSARQMPDPTGGGAVMGLAVGKLTNAVPGLQILACCASRNDTTTQRKLVCLDNAGNTLWTKYFHYDVYNAQIRTISGTTYIFVAGGSHDHTSPPALGWGFVAMLSANGDLLATFNIPSSSKSATWGDVNNDGIEELIISCDDGKIYILRVSP